ncbi:hypothetical protein C1H46_007861 [Malus baccata]|uniref:Uncharacterized protein n=1 Tax=Malus baccata TaxID=106549 RepID=A0A540N7M9_MALBA|nr:hypothetical protein C1H46_007861 [Malus baccata]
MKTGVNLVWHDGDGGDACSIIHEIVAVPSDGDGIHEIRAVPSDGEYQVKRRSRRGISLRACLGGSPHGT